MLRIGLSLSGGGAKGAAHIGVLKCLEDNGIEIDILSGTSSGSMVGLLYAMGLKPDQILSLLLSTKLSSIFTVTKLWSKYGLIDSKALIILLREKLEEMNIRTNVMIKDLKIPVFVPATDILNGNEFIFSRESTPFHDPLKVMLASSSYPMVFSPMELNQTLYSDGGILNHFPANLIHKKCSFLIGSYVTPHEKYTKENKEELKSPKNVVMRALSIQGSINELKKFELCDFVFSPNKLTKYKTFDASEKAIKKLFLIGYKEMEKEKELIKLLQKLMRYKKIINK